MFYPNARAGVHVYRNVDVESIMDTATPHRLVLMLFGGARAAVAAARGHLQRKEVAAKGASIGQAIAIIDGGLKASLDLKVGGPMAQSLADLYAYMVQRLLEANLNNDGQKLDEVALLLEQLGGAWESIGVKAAPSAAAPAPATRPALAPVPAPTVEAPPMRTAPAPPAAMAPAVSMQSRRLASAYGAF